MRRGPSVGFGVLFVAIVCATVLLASALLRADASIDRQAPGFYIEEYSSIVVTATPEEE
jgi:hypothetical protein